MWAKNSSVLTEQQVGEFIAAHRLPARFDALIREYYEPLAAWVGQQKLAGETLLVGINGAQGTGKSTLADFLKKTLETDSNLRVVVLSLDDFYLGKAQRKQLAEEVHPLLQTRGVPGTHDMHMLDAALSSLQTLDAGSELRLPCFDKARDERADKIHWRVVTGPVDIIVLEGWCVGSTAQPDAELRAPVNVLEEQEDGSSNWRGFINEALKGVYAKSFSGINLLIFLKVPSFDAVLRWRYEQEEKLAASLPAGTCDTMSREQVLRFIQHYERITMNNLAVMPLTADAVLELDENHDGLKMYHNP